jgi:hypothetical protein
MARPHRTVMRAEANVVLGAWSMIKILIASPDQKFDGPPSLTAPPGSQ